MSETTEYERERQKIKAKCICVDDDAGRCFFVRYPTLDDDEADAQSEEECECVCHGELAELDEEINGTEA